LTRDTIAIHWEWEGKLVQIADTAGIRRLSQRNHGDNIEDAAVQDAMRAMKKSDVAVLVLDAEAQVLHRQELAIASAVVREGRSLVVAANKMDLLIDNNYRPEDFARQVQEQIEIRFPMLRKTPVVAMSSLTGENVDDLMPVVFNARDRWSRTIKTGILNTWLAEVIASQAPPKEKGRATKIKYIMQTKGRPPTFLLFSNQDSLPESYLRYLTRSFQDTFEMFGMEVRLVVKKSSTSNPFDDGKRRQGRGVGGREARKQRILAELRTTGTVTHKKGKRLRYTKRRFS
jgi:GTP-binding protein